MKDKTAVGKIKNKYKRSPIMPIPVNIKIEYKNTLIKSSIAFVKVFIYPVYHNYR